MRILKASLIVLVITFICSYRAFTVYKSGNAILHDAKYYHLFVPYERSNANNLDQADFVDYAVVSFARSDLNKMRPKVLTVTLIGFILSLIPAFLFYKRSLRQFNLKLEKQPKNVQTKPKDREQLDSVNDPEIFDEAIKKFNKK